MPEHMGCKPGAYVYVAKKEISNEQKLQEILTQRLVPRFKSPKGQSIVGNCQELGSICHLSG
jgi:hypothetical protein